MDKVSNFEILTNSNLWVATPWDYSSSRWLRFRPDGNSDCCYGYGQTIYAIINFQFEIVTENTLKITFLESSALADGLYFKGFTPTQDNRTKEVQFQLVKEIFTGSKNITGREFKYHWILNLSSSPFPEILKLPYEVPLDYYGHSEYSDRKNNE